MKNTLFWTFTYLNFFGQNKKFQDDKQGLPLINATACYLASSLSSSVCPTCRLTVYMIAETTGAVDTVKTKTSVLAAGPLTDTSK